MQDYICRRRLKSAHLGLAAGLGFGFYMTLTSHLHLLFPQFAKTLVQIWQEIYPGYRPTFWGSFILFAWGFVEAFFVLWMIGTLYNGLTRYGYGLSLPKKRGIRDPLAQNQKPTEKV